MDVASRETLAKRAGKYGAMEEVEIGAGVADLQFAHSVVAGLSDAPRWVPSRFLYDAAGSQLFEEISAQPEYYLTRTETTILERHARELPQVTGPLTLIELGPGTSEKTDYLLNAYAAGGQPLRYVCVDVSAAALDEAKRRIADRHPRVEVQSVVGRYEEAFRLFRAHWPCLVIFLGSTVGNLNHDESFVFWARIGRALTDGDFFLLGVDLVKDPAVLEAAYNDAAGITAAFTKNLFGRMNRELGAGLDLGAIEHIARYNQAWRRMEIAARFTRAQALHVAPLDVTIEIAPDEQVMVEISRKFVLEDLTRYLACFGLATRAVYTDERRWFGVLLLEKKGTIR